MTVRGAVERDVWAVLFDIEKERYAQDEKWGVQGHPDAAVVPLTNRIPTADAMRRVNDGRVEDGHLAWDGILLEEVAEALEAIGDEQHLREELVQVAAVATAWVQAIDRRAGTQPSNEERFDEARRATATA